MPLILQTPVDKTIVAGGGFSDATQTESPNPDTDTSHLEAYLRRKIPVNSQAFSIFVVLQDTDVAVLLLVHFDKMKCSKIWMKR